VISARAITAISAAEAKAMVDVTVTTTTGHKRHVINRPL
jgi:hypothetical protein